MSEAYPVIEIEEDWVLKPEQLGSKEKFWFRDPSDEKQNNWLFKYPTPGTGQHWAEKIAYEIAGEMKILAPKVELAVFDGQQGSATISFTDTNYELFHGNQILAGMDNKYDPAKSGRQQMHTVQRIMASFEIFVDAEFADRCRLEMAEYLVFDAVIGNVDRHHEN